MIHALEELPRRFHIPGLMPSISTVAPAGRTRFFENLLRTKQRLYPNGRFQMQFSLHTTDTVARRRLVPIRTMSLEEMAAFGNRFYEAGDRKITLNFAPAQGLPLVPETLGPIFSPERFLIKLTPINPTRSACQSGLKGLIDPSKGERCERIIERFEALGYDTILSIGEPKENEIGSNCGMYVARIREAGDTDRVQTSQLT